MASTNFLVDSLLTFHSHPNQQKLVQQMATMMAQNWAAYFQQFCSPQQFIQISTPQIIQPNLNFNKLWPNWMFIPSLFLPPPIHQNNPFANFVQLFSVSHSNEHSANLPNPSAYGPIHEFEWLKRQKQTRRSEKGQKLKAQKGKKRHAFTAAQTEFLEEHFKAHRYISLEQRTQISNYLGLTEQQVKIWFQNRRYKAKTGRKPVGGNKIENQQNATIEAGEMDEN